jgi:CRP/FNR family transcriptional regulator
MNRDELKSYLGVTTESLSRAFSSLEKKKYFKVKNREISEINFKKLNELLDLT